MSVGHNKIIGLIKPLVEAMGYLLWHVDIHSFNHKTLLRIYIDLPLGDDKHSGITLDDCSKVSNQIGALLDVEEAIKDGYTLEVSSCGIDRGLFNLEHYKRYVNHEISVSLFKPLDGQKKITGKLLDVNNDELRLEVDKKECRFALTDISKAKLISELR